MKQEKATLGFPSQIFKAYDIRGVYPHEINEDIVARIVSGLGYHMQEKFQRSRSIVVVVGHDARLSSSTLYRNAVRSLRSEAIKVIPAGLITTPMLAFLVNRYKAHLGIMITASHNPKQFNGIKAVGKSGVPLSGKEIIDILQR